jgi:hypothetical protein
MIINLEKPPLDELVHFGVLGMKWGKRKRQDSVQILKARSLAKQRKTEMATIQKKANKESFYGLTIPSAKTTRELNTATREYKYSKQDLKSTKILERINGKVKSKTQLSLEEKYKEKGMNKDEAAVAAYHNIKVRKLLAVAGTAAVVYAAYKIHDARVDKIIKSGTRLQNISSDSTTGIRDAFYSSSNKLDNMKYQGLYGKTLSSPGDSPGAFKKEIKVLSDIRQASHKNAQKTLSELMKSDPEFEKSVSDYVLGTGPVGFQGKYFEKSVKARAELSKGKIGKNVYEVFNASLVDHSPEMQPLTDKYYKALSGKGYNAIKDINDSKYSGYKALNPIIAFNTTGKVNVVDVKQLADKEIGKAGKIAYAHIIGSDLVKTGAQIAGGIFGWRSLNSALDNKMATQYRKKHPGTKLSNTEIIRMNERSK